MDIPHLFIAYLFILAFGGAIIEHIIIPWQNKHTTHN